MLERLVGRLLNNVLSQYFVSEHTPGDGEAPLEGAPQPSLGVWSGYIALDNLRLKTEVINDLLQKRGIPLEVLHCTIRRVEITVPWSKLRQRPDNNNTMAAASPAGDSSGSSGAVVVIVMDGIHILARTLYEFHDAKMRQQDVQQRRATLQEAQTFDHHSSRSNSEKDQQQQQQSSSSWYSLGGLKDFVKRRMSEGLLQQIADKLHVHIRDLHVRLEDAETDPVHPFACGIIMESMHVQHSDDELGGSQRSTSKSRRVSAGVASEEDDHNELFPHDDMTTSDNSSVNGGTTKEVIRKVAQVNHYAIYWNALGYEEGLPLEHSVLHQLPTLTSPQLIAAALDRGIARRASALWSSPGGRMVVPAHNYLLMPMDFSLQAVLSIDPTGQTKTPSIEATFHVDAVNVQLRDFQCHQVALMIRTMKEHKFTKPYRKFRPEVSVHENPGAWWRYAFRVVSYELKGSRLRWSWGRMRQKYAGRHRYCELYERKVKYDVYMGRAFAAAGQGSLSALVETTFDTTPDDGAGPTLYSDTNSTTSLDSQQQRVQEQQPQSAHQQHDESRPWTEAERQESQDFEDGVTGDMSVQDLLLYRLLVHNRLGQDYQARQQQAEANQSLAESWIFGSSMVQNAMRDDIECQLEVQRLTAYLEHSSTTEAIHEEEDQERQNDSFLTIRFHWKEGCLAVFSPLPSMADEPSLLRRLHERFLDFTFEKLSVGYSLMGDYETMNIDLSLRDYMITEIRSRQERKRYPILSRRQPCESTQVSDTRRTFESKVSFSEKGGDASNGDLDTTSDEGQPQASPLSPLLFVEVGVNPPQQEGCRVTVKAKVEAVEILLVPDCQWIRRLKEFLRHSTASGSGKMEDYWKGLNYASINAWASKRLGLRAKAEAAMEGHKSINLDVFVQCPIIQILGEGNKKIWIDLGIAHLKTVKLAGVASKDLKFYEKDEKMFQGGKANVDASAVRNLVSALDRVAKTDNLVESDRSIGLGLLSSSPGLESYLEGPTAAVSFDNRTATSPVRHSTTGRKRSQTGAFGSSARSVGWFDEDRTVASTHAAKQEDDIHSSFFYDVYQLQIKTGKSIVGEWCESNASELQDPLIAGLQIQVNIHKSIIPADHTLCRFRIDCIISDISAAVSPTTLVYMATILRTWRSVVAEPYDVRAQIHHLPVQGPNLDMYGGLGGYVEDTPSVQDENNPQNASIASGSHIDEDEFFDAVENDENSEHLSMWLEDNWIADADSVLDGNSSTHRQRRHKSAMSDVSSLSDRSLKKRRRPKDTGAYLSQENLAMLDEGMVEEESLDEEDIESDSFHSAVSPSHVAELVSELDKNIQDARDRLSNLKNKLSEISQPRGKQLLPDSSRQRRLLKKSLKLEQERLRAELKEMVATRYDLSVQLAAMEENKDPDTEATATIGVGANARRASLLLTARKGNENTFDAAAMQHNMTRNLNPQLIQCTIVLSKISLTIKDVEVPQREGCAFDTTLCLSQGAVALRHSVNETKVFLSVEHANASYRNKNGSNSQQRYVFLGGSQYSLASSLLPSHFPQYISSASMEEKLIKCTLELRHRAATKNSLKYPEIVKLRATLGDLEATPEPELFEAWVSCGMQMKQEAGPIRGGPTSSEVKQAKKNRTVPDYLDIALQLASVRVVLNQNSKAVAALTLTEIGLRFAQSSANAVYKSRHQVDLRCSNIQVLHIEDLNLGKGSEVMGRRDAFHPLIQLRLRSQMVPSSEAGGWAAGSRSSAQRHLGDDEEEVWNVHAGVKVNCLGITAASDAILPIRSSVEDLLRIKSLVKQKAPDRDEDNVVDQVNGDNGREQTNGVDLNKKENGRRPIRWRADVAMKKTSVAFLSKDGKDWEPRDGTRNSLLLTWTLLASFEEDSHIDEATSLKVAMTDVSIVRSIDELHLLEPLDVLLNGHINLKLQSKRPMQPNLRLPVDSPWNEVAAVLHRHGWDVSRDENRSDTPTCLGLLVTATKINLSAQLCAFLAGVVASLSKPGDAREERTKVAERKPPAIDARVQDFCFLVAFRSVDLVLLRETGGKSTDSFASFQVENVEVSLRKRNRSVCMKASVADVFIFDLSCRPGVNALARRYYRREHENVSGLHRDTLCANVQLSESNGTTVVKVDLHFGNLRCIVLPSLLQGLLTFKSEVASLMPTKDKTKHKSKKGGENGSPPRHLDVFFSFAVDGFDCVLSSREISSYVREQAKEAISVVSFRWKSSGEAMFVLCGLDDASDMLEKLANFRGKSTGKEANEEFVDLVEHHATKIITSHSSIFASKVFLSVHELQGLRTSILPLARSEKDFTPYFFKVSPPTAGEQLITSSFDFNLAYQAFAARVYFLMSPNGDDENDTQLASTFEFAHSLRLEAQLIDVLLYIAQSAGGMHDSLRVTVIPVIEMLQRKEHRDTNSKEEDSDTSPKHQRESNSLAGSVKKAALVCSIKADGIRVTCVPGGATRLTESPIITFSLLNFKLGLAVCPAPVESKLLAGAAIEGIVEKKDIVASLQQQQHLMLGAWLNCELTASYHNRRLVAWEPFIEPWTMEVRFGADLVKLLKLSPTAHSFHSGWHSELDQGETALSGYTGERLRDIRNLLRSPFRKSIGNEKEAVMTSTKRFPIGSDFGYLMLVLASNSLVAMALHPSISASKNLVLSIKGELEAFLPSRSPLQWLVCFGHPRAVTDADTNAASTPFFSCAVSDVKPLNINLTGALIENVLGYLKQEKSRTVAPHWIRNDSGLTIRFREVLEEERVHKGERASKVTLSAGTEVPLSLKRTLSQTSDPHRAYIFIELGSFEDTVGRIDHQKLDPQKLSTMFFYKLVAKVPVDTVGVHRYPLDRNVEMRSSLRDIKDSDSRSLGWLIVRVALHGGIKLVSIESPLAVKNDTDSDLLCEIRAHDRLSLLWRYLIPKPEERKQSVIKCYVPVDIVPFVHDKSFELTVKALPRNASFSHESELPSSDGSHAIQIRAPRPFSHSSLSRGLIDEVDVTFQAFSYPGPARYYEQVHLNVCSLRIGTFDASQLERNASDLIPEQRMLLFRSPLAVRNYLAFPIKVQVRVKMASAMNILSATSADESELDDARWEDLGILECGETTSWTGAVSMDQVEIRVKFVSKNPQKSRRFVSWSSVATIPAMNAERRREAQYDNHASISNPKLRVVDTSGLPLYLSIAIGGGSRSGGGVGIDSIAALPPASRVASIYVPFWIVDSTGQDLEFSSRSLVAGQFNSTTDFVQSVDSGRGGPGLTMGLAELLEDAKLSHLPSKSSFSILLLGDNRSKRLSIRQRVMREHAGKGLVAPWSEPIPLRASNNRHSDVTVPPPLREFNSLMADQQSRILEPYALRSRVVAAPEKFGGKLGTKIVHVVCRYAIVNELGREIEIIAEHSQGTPILIRADGRPTPFHFDDSGPIQFRPKEFGWVWSGRFFVRQDRREVTIRIRHKLKQQMIIVNAEIHAKQKNGTCMIVLRAASHPPFRFENNTMYPLSFLQANLSTNENDIVYNREVASSETILLPYHHEDFAWDEPEHVRKTVQFEVADFGNRVKQSMLGRFNLDRIAPGTELKMDSPLFIGQVIADGPTRVLRISESSMPRLQGPGVSNEANFRNRDEGSHVTFFVSVRLTHGLGVSVVDWSPQELLFLRLEEINVTQRVDASKQKIDASIGRISIDNQLWVSPYPVLLEMGSRKLASTLAQIARRKGRRHRAVSLSLCRPLISTGLYGDLTLLEWLDLVTDPISIYIDGSLAISLSRMLQQAIELGSDGDDILQSRNATLCKVLSIPESSDMKRKAMMGTSDVYSAGDAVTTAAIAAKARSCHSSQAADLNATSMDNDGQPSLAKARRKCYVEKLRISTTNLEISWSGSFPFLSTQLLMPLSLTFERFPLLLRPYSSSHAYGTVEDHLQSLKGHYLSVWRVIDLLLGLASKPTFLINAVVYTLSEAVASTLSSISRKMAKSKETMLLKVRETKPQPFYEDGLIPSDSNAMVPLRWKLSGPFIRLAASCLQSCERASGFGAALFRYDPAKYGGGRRRKAGLVRTRNPRLFANVDGKDLLVEYSEGENAGKALLSRIRMGMHLGEGYIYHIEGLYRRLEAGVWSSSTKIPGNLIFMMTFERMALVVGDLSLDFCAVVWEVTFDNLIHLEATQSADPGFEALTIWYLANSLRENKKGEELIMTKYAKSLVGDPDCGIDNLRCTHVFVPQGHIKVLLAKARAAKTMA